MPKTNKPRSVLKKFDAAKLCSLPWKRIAIYSLLGLLVVSVLFQIVYPRDRLLPLASIDGRSHGWQTRQEAVDQLDSAYDQAKISIKLGDRSDDFATPTLQQAGISIANTDRVAALKYPWYLRVVPSSILWAQALWDVPSPQPTFSDQTDKYIKASLMPQCELAPVDAGLKADGDKLVVQPAVPGGKCTQDAVTTSMREVRPQLQVPSIVRMPLQVVPPVISDEAAKTLAAKINSNIADGVAISVGAATAQIPAETVVGWVQTSVYEQKLIVDLSAEKADSYLNASIVSSVAVAPGTSYITTYDFAVVSRVDGSSGRALDQTKTLETIRSVLLGDAQQATAVTKVVPPLERYSRTYSPTDAGFNALFANFARDNEGSYAMSFVELGGKKRRAEYQGDKRFVTASTYKLFAAYSLLRRIDDGRESWSANSDCFNRMITNSDNPCAEGYLERFGLTPITRDIQAIGLSNSNFTEKGGPYTTANDLALLLGQLQTGQNFSATNRDRLLGAMRANIFRQGIPSGTSATVANKVGFLDGLLHDAAIVYSPSGTYVLVIMSDGSSWAKLADLTRQLETLRTS